MWKKIGALVLIAVLTGIVNAQGIWDLDWNITGSGARAAGMGNAFIGIADDATAINWNPGGLAALEHFEASFVASSISDKFEYEYTYLSGDTYSDDLSYNHFTLNFLSLAYPMNVIERKLVLAAAFQKQLDFFYEEEGDGYKYTADGGVYTINLGGSYQITPYISAGLTGNIWTGKAEYKYEDDDFGQDEEEYKDFKGFNLTLGTMFDFSAINDKVPLKIGAVVKTPFDMSFTMADEDEEFDVIFEIPLMFGIGASYRLGDNFTMSIDFERRNYAKSNFEISFYEEDFEGPMSESEKDVTQFRFGMEYLVITDNFVIPIRGGLFNYPTLWANKEYDCYYDYFDGGYYYDEQNYSKKQVVGYGLSLGSGIILDKFAFDFSFNFLNYENTTTYYYIDGPWDGYEEESFKDNTKGTVNLSAIVYLDQFMNK
jgi:long-subunit fatty acid transport protein